MKTKMKTRRINTLALWPVVCGLGGILSGSAPVEAGVVPLSFTYESSSADVEVLAEVCTPTGRVADTNSGWGPMSASAYASVSAYGGYASGEGEVDLAYDDAGGCAALRSEYSASGSVEQGEEDTVSGVTVNFHILLRGWLQVGTSSGYPDGSPLDLEIVAGDGGTGDQMAYGCEITSDDPRSPVDMYLWHGYEQATIPVVAGQDLHVQLTGMASPGWSSWPDPHDSGASSGGVSMDFEVVPEPDTLCLLALGSLAVLRRRCRRQHG